MTAETQERTKGGKARLVYPGMGVLFTVLVCCFLSWGIAADLTTPMVGRGSPSSWPGHTND